MARVLKVDDRDLAPYLVVEHEGGLDPANPEYSEPQFSGSPAFSEGQAFAGDAVSNRLLTFPMVLKAGTTDALYQLVRDINQDLFKGATVEYRGDTATNSTFFDLERGRLEPKFEYWLDQAGRVRAMLHLWVRPYGHTGTYRSLIPSVAATGPRQFVATGILGDVAADALLQVDSRPSYIASTAAPHIVAYGITPNPSYAGVWNAASMAEAPLMPFSLVGASGAVASQYFGVAPSAYSPFQNVMKIPHSDVTANAYTGRQRVLLIAKSRISYASAPAMLRLNYENAHNSQTIGTAAATQSAGWRVFDMGEFTLPSAPSGLGQASSNAFQLTWMYLNASSAASTIASPALQINSIILVPLDTAAGIQVGTGWAQTLSGGDPHLLFGRGQVIRNWSATRYLRDESATLRGDLPQLPPTGTAMASGAAQMVFLSGDPTNFIGNRPIGVSLAAREKFTYLR